MTFKSAANTDGLSVDFVGRIRQTKNCALIHPTLHVLGLACQGILGLQVNSTVGGKFAPNETA